MKRLYHFLKSTALGGLVVLIPLGILGYIVADVVGIIGKAVTPVLEVLPFKSLGGVSITVLVSIGALIGLCFLAGLLAETTLVRGVVNRLERFVLSNVPGYSLMKNVGENMIGVEGKNARRAVLVRMESSTQLGLPMDTMSDGRLVVFIPNAPNAFTGTLHIVTADRVEQTGIPVSTAIDVVSRLGIGLKEELAKSPPTSTAVPEQPVVAVPAQPVAG